MRIAYVSDQYWPVVSGVPVSIDAFRDELEKKGHEVYLLVPDYPGAKEFDESKNLRRIFRFRSFKLFFKDNNRLVRISEKKNVYKVLDKIKPDIIHVHTEFILSKIAISYARKNKIPVYITSHTNWEELVALYFPFVPERLARIYCRIHMRTMLNRADTIITPTSLMEVLLNLYYIRKPIRVIPTGIVREDFKKIKLNGEIPHVLKEYPQLINKKILFFAGRIGKEKNIPFLIDMLKKVLWKNENTMLIIAGDGPAKEGLMTYAKNKGLDKNIIFTGFVERNKLAEFYSIADVFVFASKVESQGLVVLEAMSCGTPVVAIGKMGTREVMGGDNGGYMVDDDMEQFVERVSLLLNDEALHECKSIEALHHADKWTIDVFANKMLRLYQSGLRVNYSTDTVNEMELALNPINNGGLSKIPSGIYFRK
jgi:1,2-diacylglycerol 3-alpha-glucosyltransferase